MANRLEEIEAEMQQHNARIAQLSKATSSPLPSVAPVISSPGPDAHVLEGREERSIRRAQKVAGVSAAQGVAGQRPSVSMRTSDADIEISAQGAREGAGYGPDGKVRNDRGFVLPGATLATRPDSRTAGEMRSGQTNYQDAYRSQLRQRMASDPRAIAAHTKVQQEDAARQDAYKPRTVQQRVTSIASTLRPGDHVGVKQGNETATGSMKRDGTFAVQGFTSPSGTTIPVGPGMVRDDSGKMVPIGQETARIGKPFKEAGERANVAAAETVAMINRNRESNPAVALARKVSEYQSEQARAAAPSPAPAISDDPYRRRQSIASVARQPRATGITGARFE